MASGACDTVYYWRHGIYFYYEKIIKRQLPVVFYYVHFENDK